MKDAAQNYPIAQVMADAALLANDGALVFQKFTCAKCGARQTMDTPNVFYEKGTCEECKHTTDIRIAGCNYMAVFGRSYGARI